MSLRINLNSAAMTAHRQLSGSDNAMSKSIERLSSGFKINSAGDDPAGLVISEKLRAQVGGLNQAIKNAGDAVNMVKTAEGALNEVHRLLRSMRELAVHAANSGANDDAAIAADQAMIENAITTIDKISEETQFGNKFLLNGSSGIKANISSSGVTAVNITKAAADVTAQDTLNINVTQAAEQATLTTKDFGADDTVALGGSDGSFKINDISVSYLATDTVSAFATKINAVSDETGVVATIAGTGTITLKSKEYGSDVSMTLTGAAGVSLGGVASAVDYGADVHADVTRTGGTQYAEAATAWTAGTGTTLKDADGNTIQLTATAAGSVANLNKVADTVKGSLTFQVGAYSGQTRELNISSVRTDSIGTGTGSSVSAIDVTTAAGAQAALDILDSAIADVSSIRANLGATQRNVLESSINSLTVAKENISASESSIRDADMAAEMVDFTRNQIMQQAGVSMLSQANQAPQALLSLLR